MIDACSITLLSRMGPLPHNMCRAIVKSYIEETTNTPTRGCSLFATHTYHHMQHNNQSIVQSVCTPVPITCIRGLWTCPTAHHRTRHPYHCHIYSALCSPRALHTYVHTPVRTTSCYCLCWLRYSIMQGPILCRSVVFHTQLSPWAIQSPLTHVYTCEYMHITHTSHSHIRTSGTNTSAHKYTHFTFTHATHTRHTHT